MNKIMIIKQNRKRAKLFMKIIKVKKEDYFQRMKKMKKKKIYKSLCLFLLLEDLKGFQKSSEEVLIKLSIEGLIMILGEKLLGV
jgi:hypothetical protein